MKIRTLQEASTTSRHVKAPNWQSVRLILEDDNVGFSFHITTMFAGTETVMEYKNHIECVYCIEGTGELEVVSSGEQHIIRPGLLYLLDDHDRHIVRPQTDIFIACVFNPALRGNETHGSDGSYPGPESGSA